MYNSLNLKSLMATRGVRIVDLVKTTKVSKSTIIGMLSENANPSADKLERIADVLRCPIDAFFDRKEIYAMPDTSHVPVAGEVLRYASVSEEVLLLRKENEYLKELLKEKERLISVIITNEKK